MRRVTGVLMHPRATMAEVVRHPAFITTWVVVLLAVAVCGGLLLSTPVGRQALVDERVRVTEALGGRVDDAAYARLQANPPLLVYLTSGGRLLLTPPVTLAGGGGAGGAGAHRRCRGCGSVTALAIAVHASVVLALQQIVATPVHYVSESLTSPTNLGGILRAVRRGHLAGARVRDDRRVRVVVDVAAERRAGGRDRQTGAAIFMAADGRLCGRGSARRRGVRGVGRGHLGISDLGGCRISDLDWD